MGVANAILPHSFFPEKYTEPLCLFVAAQEKNKMQKTKKASTTVAK